MENAEPPVVLGPREGERVGGSEVKAARPELSVIEFEVRPGDGVDLEPDDAFFEPHDVFDP